jgi:hypothetical protein
MVLLDYDYGTSDVFEFDAVVYAEALEPIREV